MRSKRKFKKYINGTGGSVKNLPCIIGVVGLSSGQGTKTLHATEQLETHATTTEAHTLWNPCTTTRASVHHIKRSCMTQQRSCVPQLRHNAAK